MRPQFPTRANSDMQKLPETHHPICDYLYVGTSALATQGPACVNVFPFNARTGEIGDRLQALPSVNPSYFWAHPTRPGLYAVNETRGHAGHAEGTISHFHRDRASGKLALVAAVSSGGSLPCHLSGTSDALVVAHYEGSTVALLPLAPDGHLQPPVSTVTHCGTGPHPTRQLKPHPHGAHMTNNGSQCLVPDLGIDAVLLYDISDFKLREKKRWQAPPGCGPRHVAMHPSKPLAYLLTELSNEVFILHLEPQNDQAMIRIGSSLPATFNVTSGGSEIAVHPTGRLLAASNRGHDSIAFWALDPKGFPEKPMFLRLQGACPRHFIFSNCGSWLIVALQESDCVDVYALDPGSGLPKDPPVSSRAVDLPVSLCLC